MFVAPVVYCLLLKTTHPVPLHQSVMKKWTLSLNSHNSVAEAASRTDFLSLTDSGTTSPEKATDGQSIGQEECVSGVESGLNLKAFQV